MRTREEIVSQRNKRARDLAREAGLLGATKDMRLSALVLAKLVEAAKNSINVKSNSELLEIALLRLVLDEGFGSKILKRQGKLAKAENLVS